LEVNVKIDCINGQVGIYCNLLQIFCIKMISGHNHEKDEEVISIVSIVCVRIIRILKGDVAQNLFLWDGSTWTFMFWWPSFWWQIKIKNFQKKIISFRYIVKQEMNLEVQSSIIYFVCLLLNIYFLFIYNLCKISLIFVCLIEL
jgi:hypothetical protein